MTCKAIQVYNDMTLSAEALWGELSSINDMSLLSDSSPLVVDWVLVYGVAVLSLIGFNLSFRRFSEFSACRESERHRAETVQELPLIFFL
jgi:hypothetical protein